jgi:type IV pilus assembly protein PilA
MKENVARLLLLKRTTMLRKTCHQSDGFTLLEVIFVSGIIALISGIAVPSLLRSRAAANETSTLGTVRTVHTAQLTYALTCGKGLYAESFKALGGANAFLPPDMTNNATPLKTGYRFTLQPGPGGVTAFTDCNGAAIAVDYYITAEPIRVGETGSRGFASNQAHLIWQDTTGAAPVEPFTLGATVSPLGAD